MYQAKLTAQHATYNLARAALVARPELLERLEQYLMHSLVSAVNAAIDEIRADYNEASYLYPFWQNYPPDDRGRQPIADQYPWIEVGEHAIGSKLSRLLSKEFSLRDVGLPTGADQRFVVTNEKILELTEGITSSAWLFVDIKSVGPRDDADHTVMSHNQISGNGDWTIAQGGVTNTILAATGARTSHDFHCTMPPLYVLSDGTIAPVVTVALKPVYSMRATTTSTHRNLGQPLSRIDFACIPNGLLLTVNPAYLVTHKSLLFPGKDDKSKDPRKLRARVSFGILRQIGAWRHQSLQVAPPA